MQVTSVNSTAASAISPNPAEDTARRADDFSRVLQNAFYGAGSKAVATGAQQASQDSTPRTETRPVERSERPAADRPVEKPVERSDSRDQTTKTDTAPRDAASKPADKPVQKSDDKPVAKDDAAQTTDQADDKTAAQTKPAEASKADGEKADTKPAAEDLTDAAEETKPVVADAPDALLILNLLQTPVTPVAVAAAPVATAPAAALAVDAQAQAAAPAMVPVAVAPVVPDAAAQIAAAATAAPAVTGVAAQLPAEAAAPQLPVDAEAAKAAALAAAQAAAQQAAAGEGTETSVAALLSQQQTMSKEDFAAIQQQLATQAQAQLQADVKTVVAEPQQQMQAAQPLVAAAVVAAAPKTETKPEKSLTLDVQTVSAVAPKTLVDQSALMAMQGDDDLADAALLQQQAQAQVPQQPVAADAKFAAALQSQLINDASLQANAAPVQSAPAHIVQQQAAIAATPASQATQASQHATNQTLARNLNAYIPAGEQVAVQIKKGAAEGIDKISIRLDPGNLGNVEIKMEVGHDGRLMAVIAADKPETLQMLQKDAASLEQSLRDAGLKTDQQSLSFSLRDQNQAQAGRDGREGGAGYGRQRNRGADEYAETGRIDPAQVAAAQAQRAAAARGGLDIKI